MDDTITYFASPSPNGKWQVRRTDKPNPIMDDLDEKQVLWAARCLNEAVADGAEMARGRIREALGL